MIKQNKINIRLELIRDKLSGDFAIVAHFDSKASNVLIDKNEYTWMPTIEEKDLINDAFNFLSIKSELKKAEPKESEIKEPISKKTLVEEPFSEDPLPETIPPKESKPEEKPEELPPIEKEEPAIFEVTDENVPSEELDTEPEKEEPIDVKLDIKPDESEEEKQTEEKKDEDEGIIVEADAEAIEAALKKHTGKDDEDKTIVEADEQTIVDKVLSQKKKGKWSRK
jgi:hypothetical protein